ncbi:MAG: hypothetical protein WDZ35_05740 [Crocinitomicaceae bacterium]
MPSYKFRVLIDTDSSEEIFRDISVGSHENFEIFYRAILTAFEFSGQELASFYVSNKEWDKGHEVALMDMGLNDSLSAPSIMKETILSDLVTSSNQRFILVYDFLRMWCFLIELVEELDETYENPQLELSVGIAPDELSKDIDFSGDMNMGSMDLGNDIDDIFSDSGEDDDFDEFDDFENIDDMDI